MKALYVYAAAEGNIPRRLKSAAPSLEAAHFSARYFPLPAPTRRWPWTVILSEAKNLDTSLRMNSAKNLCDMQCHSFPPRPFASLRVTQAGSPP